MVMPTVRLTLVVVGTAAYLGLAILGWGGFAAFFSHRVREVQERLGRSLLTGFVLLVTVPVAAVLLVFTVIGGGEGPSIYWSVAVGTIALAVLFAVPFAGWVIRLVAILAGFGALWATVWRAVAARPSSPGTLSPAAGV